MLVEEVDAVFSGGGALAPVHVGALAALLERKRVVAVGGTSAGSMVAAGHACGLHTETMLDLFREAFKEGILDRSWWPLDRWGLYSGDKIHALLKQALPGRMGTLAIDCRIVVCDLSTRVPVVVSPKTHPDVQIADAVRCSLAIPGFFKASRLDPNNARLYVDGGTSANFMMSMFDDRLERTIGARFKPDGGPVRPVRTTGDYIRAVASLLMHSSNEAHISAKHYADVVTLDTTGNGMDFSLSDKQIDTLYDDGFRSMDMWLDTQP